jgi:hypothetical protein
MRPRDDGHRAACRSRGHRARAGAAAIVLIAACGDNADPTDSATPPEQVEPTLLVVGRFGELATVGLDAPWSVRASITLPTRFASVRYHRGAFYAVQAQRITVLAMDLTVRGEIFLPGADARDIVFVDDRTAVASLGSIPILARIDLVTDTISGIDLRPYGTAVATGMLAACGPRVFVQLATPGVGIVDLTPIGERLLDGDDKTLGVQPIPLASTSAFAIQTDCRDSALYVAEPAPLTLGGGQYQRIDLATFATSTPGLASGLGEVGGFHVVAPDEGWFIVHTELGPSASSHLQHITPTSQASVWDTFAPVNIDHLAADAETGQLFFPDGCTTDCQPGHATGVQVFDLHSGAQLSTTAPIAVGFPPADVVVAR